MSRTRYRFGEDHYPHFMTATIVAWLPVFSYPCFVEVILNSWRFLQTKREINFLAFVIMENHLHWIAVGPQFERSLLYWPKWFDRCVYRLAVMVWRRRARQSLQGSAFPGRSLGTS
ncbi:MAG TPA: hypothetical protein VMM76_20405 [Pirellulaceae bacterium]|nr:hypothetical protein [Pirellulaceae bacterium]